MKPSQKQTQRQPHFSKDSAKKSDFSAKMIDVQSLVLHAQKR